MGTYWVGVLVLMVCSSAFGDEGMWLFNQPPREILRERYKFDVSDAWLEHLQKSSARFNSGGSGSFLSEDGLLISNHHVGADALLKVSTKEKNYLRDGFYARTQAEEIKCLDLEINVLQSIEDVTERVNAAVPASSTAGEAFEARRKVIAEIEKDSLDRTGLRSDVVTLWQGGAYHLYCYKRYTDVRIVFAPEQQTAFYGGDPDNFEYPRHDLDICLFRVYQNGKPAMIKDFLRFSAAGPSEGDLVFISGHPGRTSRSFTVAELEYKRDQDVPSRLESLKRLEVLLGNWSRRAEENARECRDDFFYVQNSRKLLDGEIAGLLEPEVFAAKIKEEAEFEAKLAGKPEFAAALGAYDKIAAATRVLAAQATRYKFLEDRPYDSARAFNSECYRYARTLLRAGDERSKPNGQRLQEYSDAGKESLELELFSAKPIYTGLEILTLSDSLTYLCSKLGVGDPLVSKILANKSPHDRAVELIKGTKVRDLAFRKALYAGGASPVTAAKDPMIELARLVDAEARAMRKVAEEQQEIKKQAHAELARARNALLGTASNPDATFTLRLAFGTVKGYEEEGKQVPVFTTFASLYERAKEMKNEPPFDLTPTWQKARSHVNLKTPLNFVDTCDTVGGNSGSPVVNRAGEFVGIVFDGNLQTLSWDYAFSDKQGRDIAVDSAAILEALKNVYGVKELVRELVTGRRGK